MPATARALPPEFDRFLNIPALTGSAGNLLDELRTMLEANAQFTAGDLEYALMDLDIVKLGTSSAIVATIKRVEEMLAAGNFGRDPLDDIDRHFIRARKRLKDEDVVQMARELHGMVKEMGLSHAAFVGFFERTKLPDGVTLPWSATTLDGVLDLLPKEVGAQGVAPADPAGDGGEDPADAQGDPEAGDATQDPTQGGSDEQSQPTSSSLPQESEMTSGETSSSESGPTSGGTSTDSAPSSIESPAGTLSAGQPAGGDTVVLLGSLQDGAAPLYYEGMELARVRRCGDQPFIRCELLKRHGRRPKGGTVDLSPETEVSLVAPTEGPKAPRAKAEPAHPTREERKEDVRHMDGTNPGEALGDGDPLGDAAPTPQRVEVRVAPPVQPASAYNGPHADSQDVTTLHVLEQKLKSLHDEREILDEQILDVKRSITRLCQTSSEARGVLQVQLTDAKRFLATTNDIANALTETKA